jgi:hypothetical protein
VAAQIESGEVLGNWVADEVGGGVIFEAAEEKAVARMNHGDSGLIEEIQIENTVGFGWGWG